MRRFSFVTIFAKDNTLPLLMGILVTFVGLDLLLNLPKNKTIEPLSVVFLAVGGWILWRTVRRTDNQKAVHSDESEKTLASRLILAIIFKGKARMILPIAGALTVLADLLYNRYLSATPALLTEDIILLSAGLVLMAYNFLPSSIQREKDFALVLALVLLATLVLPLMIARLYYSDFEKSVDVYSWTLLAPQTSWILNGLGVRSTLLELPGYTAPGLLFSTVSGAPVLVVITTACSGIYSFGIFASGYVALISVEFAKLSRRVALLGMIGILAAYIANILRMVSILLVGFYTDSESTNMQNLLLAHSNAGWLIFLGWLSVFWLVVFKYLRPWAAKTETGGPFMSTEAL